MVGGEVFVPKLPSYNICQLANVMAPNIEQKEIGIRPGEKIHESMIGEYESYLTIDNKEERKLRKFKNNKT